MAQKIVYIAEISYSNFINFGKHICDGTYIKAFDTEKFASIEAPRQAGELLFGINDNVPTQCTIHLNEFLPKAHKTSEPTKHKSCFVACFEQDAKIILPRIMAYMYDIDNKGVNMFRLLKTPTRAAYRKYEVLTELTEAPVYDKETITKAVLNDMLVSDPEDCI